MNILVQDPDAEDDMFFAIPIDAEEEPVIVRLRGKGWNKAAELLTGDPAMLPLSVKKALKAKVIEA
jgi:hypothetical protein